MGKGKVTKKKKKRGGSLGDTIVVESSSEGSTSARQGQRSKGGGVWGRGGKGGGRSGRSGKGTWVEGGGEDEREERVMDHRTVNRFIAPEEERDVRKRGRNIQLDFANGISKGGSAGKDSSTPDRLLPKFKSSVFGERGGSASVNGNASSREESVVSGGGGGFEDGDGLLRRSKRYFGSRMTM